MAVHVAVGEVSDQRGGGTLTRYELQKTGKQFYVYQENNQFSLFSLIIYC